MKTKPTITIGVTAFNEEENISNLLKSILDQGQTDFSLEKIIVISDGSIDRTVDEVKSIKDKRIEIIADKINKGRVFRLNQIINMCKTDILIFLDGDETLSQKNDLENLVNEFRKDKDIALVGGNPYSIFDNSFISRCRTITRDAYTKMRYQIKNGNNIFGCMGGIYALSKKLYKNYKIPSDIFADDSFAYLTCVKRGFKFRNIRDVQINHYMENELGMHINRNTRHSKSKTELKKYFGDLVDKEFYIPRGLYLRTVVSQLLKDPIHTIFIYAINTYTRLLAKYEK